MNQYTKMSQQESELLKMRRIDTFIYKLSYPDSFVPHPEIGHREMVYNLFPYIKSVPRDQMTYEQYIKYIQATYVALSRNFDQYLEYLEQKFWDDFKNKRKKRNI